MFFNRIQTSTINLITECAETFENERTATNVRGKKYTIDRVTPIAATMGTKEAIVGYRLNGHTLSKRDIILFYDLQSPFSRHLNIAKDWQSLQFPDALCAVQAPTDDAIVLVQLNAKGLRYPRTKASSLSPYGKTSAHFFKDMFNRLAGSAPIETYAMPLYVYNMMMETPLPQQAARLMPHKAHHTLPHH